MIEKNVIQIVRIKIIIMIIIKKDNKIMLIEYIRKGKHSREKKGILIIKVVPDKILVIRRQK